MSGPILFIGDAITDARRADDPEGLGFGYVRAVAESLRRRGRPREVINRGVAGDRIGDLAARWQQDVLDLRPGTLSIYVGVNDTWRAFDQGLRTSASDFHAEYRMLLNELRVSTVPRLILMEPFLLPVSEEQATWLPDLEGKRRAVQQLAGEFRAAFVPLHRILTTAAAHQGAAALAANGIHPTEQGIALIAEAWEAAEGAARTLRSGV